MVAGCGADLLVNICLTVLGYVACFPGINKYSRHDQRTNHYSVYSFLPGHVHAFYIEYVYFDRREQAREGRLAARRAPAVYSERVQTGGQGYGTMAQSAA